MSSMPIAQIAEINGQTLAYYEWGQPGAPVLICLHRHTHSAASWRELGEFASPNYRVFALAPPPEPAQTLLLAASQMNWR